MPPRPSYIGFATLRQTVRLAAALALAAACGGCAGGLPFDDGFVATTGTTAPAPDAPRADGLAAADLLAIGSALRRSDGRAAADLVWDNPESGSQGRITRVAAIRGPGGDDCRAFRTIVNAVDGVRAVSGVACRDTAGGWAVEGVAPAEDATS